MAYFVVECARGFISSIAGNGSEEEAMGMKFISAVLLIGASVFLSGSASGGILWMDCDFPDDPTGVNHDWELVFDDGGTAGKESDDTWTVLLTEVIEASGPDIVNVSGETDSDPIIHYTKTITNNNGVDWTGYEIILSGYGVSFDYTTTPSSDVFTVVDTSDPMKLVYSAPDTVYIGDTVTLDFDILVADIGEFQLCLTQIAIPEPMSVLLLGLGGLCLIRRK